MADEHNHEHEESILPSPRFEVVSELFDKIDNLLAEVDTKEHLSLFEFEILLLMLRKKVEHMGIVASLGVSHEDDHLGHAQSQDGKSEPEFYG